MSESIPLFEAPNTDIDLSELDMPTERPGRKWLETKEKYKERTGIDYVSEPRKPSQMNLEYEPEEKLHTRESRRAKNTPRQIKLKDAQAIAELDPMQIRAYGKRMLTFLQSKELVTKFLATELGIDSDTAEHEVSEMLGEIRADFRNYIVNSDEENIMTLREMMKLALERHDTRSATEIMRTLDSITNHYLEAHDLLPEKKKQVEPEIEIVFS